ncbi:LacI family DNA-binding transcriptional regulator [Pantoea sp. NSTU24]|uniref:LacI family DNA-binding transcriptional regulator n=1 Tax=Pantoea sp. NSTU24 TaxID=3391144 RepID=UPI003D046070
MASVRIIAQAAGVSPATVSNFINNRPEKMRTETWVRIKSVIEEMGCSHLIPQQKFKQSKNIIALLLPSAASERYTLIIKSLEQAAAKFDYSVISGSGYEESVRETLFIDDMLKIGVTMLVVVKSNVFKTHFIKASERGMKVISYDSYNPNRLLSENKFFDRFSMDNYEAARFATKTLIERNHKDIIMVTEDYINEELSQKIHGFYSMQDARGSKRSDIVRSIKGSLNHIELDQFQLGRNLANVLMRENVFPDGIVATNDILAYGILYQLYTIGYILRKKLAVIALDSSANNYFPEKFLSTVSPPIKKISEDIILRLIGVNELDDLKKDFIYAPVCNLSRSLGIKKGQFIF